MTPETPEIWRKKLISYEAELGATAEPAMQARLQHAMGRLLEDRLDEPREALVHYQEAAAADPAYRPALRDARRLFRSSDQPLMAAEILHRESRCVPDAVTRAALHWERGQLLEQAGADTTEIRAAHEAALAADPTCVPALHALGPILAASADWQALSDAYGEAAGASEDPTTRAGLLCEQARVTELHLEGAEVACDMYSVAVDADPTHLVALVELERLARRCARWSLLAQTLERTAALSGAGTDAAHDLDEAAGIHLRQLGDEAAAHRCLLLALAADSEHVPSLDGAEGLLRGHASYQSLADLRGRQAEAAVGAAEKAAFLCRQADLLARLPDRSEEALTVYRRAAALSPTYLPALKELGRRLEETGEWQELVDLQLAEAAALEDPSARGERWMRAAELLERKLGLEDRAIEVLQRATGSGPGRLRAVRELVRLLGRAGRWEEAAGALVTEVESSDEPEHRVEHLRRLAEIRESHLEDRVEAVRALHELLEDRPEDLAARSELGRLLRDLEWWEELAESRLQEAELLDDARGIVALLQEAGEVVEQRIGDEARAEAMFERALSIHPGYVPALRARGRLLHRAGRFEELVDMHHRELEVASGGEARAAALLRLSDVQWRRLGRSREAEEGYREVLELRSGDQAALRALEAIYRERGDLTQLAEILETRVQSASEATDRARLLCSLGQVLEEGGASPADVLEAYSRAAAESEGCVPALRALARLHAAEGRWEEVGEVLAQEVEADGDAVRVLLRALRLASVRRDRLGDRAGALKAYERAVAADPGHIPSLQALDSLLREGRGEASPDRLGVLDALASVLDEPMAAAGARLEVAGLREASGRHERAREDYRSALGHHPGHPVAFERLEEALRQERDWPALAELYGESRTVTPDEELQVDLAIRHAAALEQSGELTRALAVLEELATHRDGDAAVIEALARVRLLSGDREGGLSLLEQLAGLRRDPALAVQDLVLCGDAWRDEVGDAGRAIDVYERALSLDPGHGGALQRLKAILSSRGEGQRLVALIAKVRVGTDDDAVRVRLDRELAGLHRESGALDSARACLEEVLARAPGDRDALRAQAEVLEALFEDAKAAESWERLARLAESEDELREAWLAVGKLCAGHDDQLERAESALLALLDRLPEDVEGLDLLVRVREQSGNLLGAAEAATKRASVAVDAREKLERLMEVARIHAQRGAPDAARVALIEARGVDPSHPDPVRSLGAMLRAAGDLPAMTTLYREYVGGLSAGDGARAIPFHMELGRIYRQREDRWEAAVEEHARVIELSPDHGEAREALAELYSSNSDTLDRGIAQHKALLVAEPFRIESYRALLRLHERQRDHDQAFLVGGILEYLGALSPEDQAGLEEFRSRVSVGPRGELDAEDRLRFLHHPDDHGALRAFLRELGSNATKLARRGARELGAGRGDRLTPREADPLLTQAERLGALLGVSAFTLYRVAGGDGIVEIGAGSPPAVVVNKSAIDLMTLPTRRFHLAQQLMLCRDGGALVADLGPEWVAAFAGAVSRLTAAKADASRPAIAFVPVAGVESKAVSDANAAVERLGERRLRKAVAPAARALRESGGGASLLAEAKAMLWTADRAGALVAGDARVACEAVGGPAAAWGGDPSAIAALTERQDLRELLAFLLCDEHLALRARLGLKVG